MSLVNPVKPKPICKLEAATKSFIVINAGEDYRQPATIGEIMAYIARVSNPGNQHNNKTAPQLLAHCLENGHWSVFESCSLTISIQTSRAIAQQILRHRSFCFQEFSQRYAAATTFERYEARRQDKSNRQDSIDDLSQADKTWFEEAQDKVWELSYGLYTEAIRRGIALECARFLLPLATTTTLYITGNVRSWIHYLLARCKKGVQKEHRDIAWGCLWVLVEHIPELRWYLAEKLLCAKILTHNLSDNLITPHSWKWFVETLRSGGYDMHYSEFPESEPFHIVKWGVGNPGEDDPRKVNICIEPWNSPALTPGNFRDSGCLDKNNLHQVKLCDRPL